MAKIDKYGVPSLKKEFPADSVCLDFIYNTLHTKQCSCGGTYSLMKGTRRYQCSKCRFKIAPTANTIFNKSDTPLTIWFQAILVFSNAKSGISAKQLERELEVTYKTAWRILTLIRKALTQSDDKLDGDVETDQSYFGGRFKSGKNNGKQKEAIAAKSILMGAVQRKGEVRMKVVPDATAFTHSSFVLKHIEPKGTRLITDKSNRYDRVARGYDRHSVDHHIGEYVRGDIYINTLDSFLAHVKRSIKGTHKVISKKYLQSYLDGFVFHYNNRYNDRARFVALLGILLHAAR